MLGVKGPNTAFTLANNVVKESFKNKTFPVNNSYKTHPNDQISIFVSYGSPKMTSGAVIILKIIIIIIIIIIIFFKWY